MADDGATTPLSAEGISILASFIIRPPRATYSRRELGPRRFHTDTPRPVAVLRTDLQLVNGRGHKLQCSHFTPYDDEVSQSVAELAAKEEGLPSSPILSSRKGDNYDDDDDDSNGAPAVTTFPLDGDSGQRVAPMPVVVFLHGNGSCRVEAEMLYEHTLPYGMSLFAFDFSGSGRSDGEYISLGVYEKLDVDTVVSYLSSLPYVTSIALWGHSMGAATATMYAGLVDPSRRKRNDKGAPHASPRRESSALPASSSLQPAKTRARRAFAMSKSGKRIAGDADDTDKMAVEVPDSPDADPANASPASSKLKALVLDSAFASFEKLAEAMVETMPLPAAVPRRLILSVGMRSVRKAVRDKAGFDVHDIDPLSACATISRSLPAILLQGTIDDIVQLPHAELLYAAYPSEDKELVVMEGIDHDSPRPKYATERAFVVLQRCLFDECGQESLRFANALKVRGNDIMVEGFFSEAIYLYTVALNALVQLDRNTSPAPPDSPPSALSQPADPVPDSLPTETGGTTTENFTDSDEWPESTCGETEDGDSRSPRMSNRWISGRLGGIVNGLSRRRSGREDLSAAQGDEELASRSPTNAHPKGDGTTSATGSPRSRGQPSIERSRSASRSDGVFGFGAGSNRKSRDITRGRLSSEAPSTQTGRRGRFSMPGRLLRRHGSNAPELDSAQDADTTAGANAARMANGSQNDKSTTPPREDLAETYIREIGLHPLQRDLALALLGNRSLARLRLREATLSLADAETALILDPKWVRGYQRKANALRALRLLPEALECVRYGLAVAPTSNTLANMEMELQFECASMAEQQQSTDKTNGDAIRLSDTERTPRDMSPSRQANSSETVISEFPPSGPSAVAS